MIRKKGIGLVLRYWFIVSSIYYVVNPLFIPAAAQKWHPQTSSTSSSYAQEEKKKTTGSPRSDASVSGIVSKKPSQWLPKSKKENSSKNKSKWIAC